MRETIDTVPVNLGDRSYEVRVGQGLIARAGVEIAPLLRRKRVAIVTEETVAALHLAPLRAALQAEGIPSEALVLPPGEGTKSWPQFERTVEWLLDQKVERGDLVVALGGGVIADLAGFPTAEIRRRVCFSYIATCLLEQVDSSVGGKTGINLPAGWLAQWQEMLVDDEQRIARPRQIYTGADVRDYVPIEQRGEAAS